jgi:hypothetical protein
MGAALPYGAPPAAGLRWPGAAVVILASGSSLTVAQCEAVRAWRRAQPTITSRPRRVIAINTTFRRAPWADVLYACDETWWRAYHEEARGSFLGELWTQDEQARRYRGVSVVPSRDAPGLSPIPGVVHQGGNSGYQAIGLAVQAGARRIALLGYDYHGPHWHGAHPAGLTNPSDDLMARWVGRMVPLADDCARVGVDVVNCTPASALRCFRTASLDDVLASLR